MREARALRFSLAPDLLCDCSRVTWIRKKLMRTVLQSKFDDLYYYNKFLTTFMVFNFLSFLETSTKLCPQQLCSPYRKETASFTVGS